MNLILFSIFYSTDISFQNWSLFEKNRTNPPLFIFLFTSWCPHCHGLVNPFKNLQKKYENNDQIIAATLDCTSQMEFCAKFQIKSFPSFILFYKSKIRGFLNPDRTEDGIQLFANKIINYYRHDCKLMERLYKNNKKTDINTPRFVCKISTNDTEKYNEAIEVINDEKLTINETFFFDPENQDLRNGNCEVYFSESQVKIMDDKLTSLSEFINYHKIGFFSKTWNFDQISTLKKFFVLVLPNNQDSISQDIIEEFEDYFSYGSIDPLGIHQIKKMFDINFDIESENQSCLIIIRVKTKNKKKIKYQIILNPNRDIIKTFLSNAAVKGQIQWDEVNDNYAKNFISEIIIDEGIKKIKLNFNDKYKTIMLGVGVLLIAIIIIGYFIFNYIHNRISSKEE